MNCCEWYPALVSIFHPLGQYSLICFAGKTYSETKSPLNLSVSQTHFYLLKLAMCFTGIISEGEELWGFFVSSFKNRCWQSDTIEWEKGKAQERPQRFVCLMWHQAHRICILELSGHPLSPLILSLITTPLVNVQPFVICSS